MCNKYTITQTLSTRGLNQHSKGNQRSPPKIETYRQKISRTKTHCSKHFYVYPEKMTMATVPNV